VRLSRDAPVRTRRSRRMGEEAASVAAERGADWLGGGARVDLS
jgi:hypothetical protein